MKTNKKIKRLLLLTIILSFQSVLFAQAPEEMSYQAIVRNSGGRIVVSDLVSMRISILKGSEIGTAVYEEYHSSTTNENGLLSISIGSGTNTTGNFSTIDWGTDSYFIKSEVDLQGTGNYTLSIVSQMMSVPYALYAKNSGDSFANGDHTVVTGQGTVVDPYIIDIDTAVMTYVPAVHYVGEEYGGGIVFFVYDNGLHGLIAAPVHGKTPLFDTSSMNISYGTFSSYTNGAQNTQTIVQLGGTDGPAAVCASLTHGGFSDWYLPAYREMALLASQDILMIKAATAAGISGYNYTYFNPNNYSGPSRYWTSTFGPGGGSSMFFDFGGDKQGCTTIPCELNQDMNPPNALASREYRFVPIRSF